MALLTTLALVSSASLALAHPHSSNTKRDVATFQAGASWDILLSKGDAVSNVKSVASQKFQVIDIDLFDTDAATISDLKASGKEVICYFSAGSQEGWRPDANDFKASDVGKGLDGWPDEKWVDVKSDNVRNIMKKRIQKAKDAGCTAVDPDNVDGFDGGQDGFNYDKSAYADYVKFMAQEASANSLAIGLKNAVDLIPDVVSVVQFAINEQCHEYSGECALYKPFTDANKAVFNIEYGGNHCDSPAGVKLSTLIKPEDQGLNTLGGACPGQSTQPQSSQAAPKPTTSTQPAPSQAPSQPATSLSATAKPTSAAAPTPTRTPTPTRVSTRPTPTPTNDPEEGDGDDEDDGDDNEPTATGRPWGWGPWHSKGKHHWGGH